jgi:hypothetical protein
MTVLHLGVLDIPYIENQPTTPQPKKAPKRPGRSRVHKQHAKKYQNISTGDVAEILETKYHIFEVFFREHEADIAKDIENSLGGAIESLLMGGPPRLDAFGSATSSIEARMKRFLSDQEMEKLGYPGVPTQAALRGVSHRFAHPYKRRAPRPSFIDTSTFMSSMKSWVD